MSSNNIPKIIHWCWFSDEDLPEDTKRCITTWKNIYPDYEIKKWDINIFKDYDLLKIPFIKQALFHKKWAELADFVRCFVLYTFGGIYFDSDVVAIKRIDKLLTNDLIIALENSDTNIFTSVFSNKKVLQYLKDISMPLWTLNPAAVISCNNHIFLKKLIDWYSNNPFIMNIDGETFLQDEVLIAPNIWALIANKYFDMVEFKPQVLKNNISIINQDLFPNGAIFKDSFINHECHGSWREHFTPKILHHVWLGGEYTNTAKYYMKTWDVFKENDFIFKKWDENNIPHNKWIDKSIKLKKYAIASDYIRFHALVNEGGLYLDTDVEILKMFENVFFKQENLIGVQSDGFIDCGTIISSKNDRKSNKFKIILDWFEDKEPKLEWLTYDENNKLPEPLTKYKCYSLSLLLYEFLIKDDTYERLGCSIHSYYSFCNCDWKTKKIVKHDDAYAIHHYTDSWHEKRRFELKDFGFNN